MDMFNALLAAAHLAIDIIIKQLAEI